MTLSLSPAALFVAPPQSSGAAPSHDPAAQLLQLLIVFAAAKVAAELFERLRQPAVVRLGAVSEPALLEVLSELGVLFLLFNVGLETRPSELRRVGAPALKAALGGVVVPFGLGYGLMLLTGAGQVQALFVGTAMVATSVGITARVLSRMGLLNTEPSRIILGAAILDDILGLLVLAVVSSLSRGRVEPLQLAATLVTSLLFVGAVLVFGGRAMNRAVPVIQRLRVGHALYLWAIGLCLLLAVVAGWLGVAAIIGAFLAGTALAEFAEDTGLHHRMENLTEFLLPFFLVSIGTRLELSSLASPMVLLLCGGVTLLAVVGKLIGCGLPLWSQRTLAMQVGWGMVPRGEVGIIVAQLGLTLGVLNADLYAVVLFMAVATTMIAPPVLVRVFRSAVAPAASEEGVVELGQSFSTELGDSAPPGPPGSAATEPENPRQRRLPDGAGGL